MSAIPQPAHLYAGPLDGRIVVAIGNRLWGQDGYYVPTARTDANGNTIWEWHPYCQKTTKA